MVALLNQKLLDLEHKYINFASKCSDLLKENFDKLKENIGDGDSHEKSGKMRLEELESHKKIFENSINLIQSFQNDIEKKSELHKAFRKISEKLYQAEISILYKYPEFLTVKSLFKEITGFI